MTDGRSLRLPRTHPLGAGEEQTKTLQQHWNTVDIVEEEIKQQGLSEHPRPQVACPELDVDTLTGTDSRSYTELYVHLLAWFAYTSELLAQVQARVLQYENMQDILAAQTRKEARDLSDAAGVKKPTVEELKDRLLLNPEYLEVMRQLQHYQQSKIMLDKKVESIERSLRVISRQVEIRRLDIEQNRTATTMPGRNQYDPLRRNPFRQGDDE